jgi:hypothetical protein
VGLGKVFEGAVFHCEDKQASSLQMFCPCLCYKPLESTFLDEKIFEALTTPPADLVTQMVATWCGSTTLFGVYHG